MSLKKEPARRRGAALETAILDAAWEQLTAAGIPEFTYEAVAARAGTSRPVLYRRWPQRDQLLKATITHGGSKVERVRPDTGSLRGDVIALLVDMNRSASDSLTLMIGHLGMIHSTESLTPEEVRLLYLGDRGNRTQEIIERAVARGEADPERVTDLVLAVPADLVRQRIMLTLRPVPRRQIEEIVDQVFLPLVAVRD